MITDQTIRGAISAHLPNGEKYPMQLVGDDAAAFIAAHNRGIDSHLEAMTDSQVAWVRHRIAVKLHCDVSPSDLFVLLRRLEEAGTDAALSLRSGILTTLDLEEP